MANDKDIIRVLGNSLLNKDIKVLRAGKKFTYKISSVTYKSEQSIELTDITNGWSQILYDYELKPLVHDGVCNHWEQGTQVFFQVDIDINNNLNKVKKWLVNEALTIVNSNDINSLSPTSIYFVVKYVIEIKENLYNISGYTHYESIELSFAQVEQLIENCEIELPELGIIVCLDYTYYNDEEEDMGIEELSDYHRFLEIKNELIGKKFVCVNNEKESFTIVSIYKLDSSIIIEGNSKENKYYLTTESFISFYSKKRVKIWDKNLGCHITVELGGDSVSNNLNSIVLKSQNSANNSSNFSSVHYIIRKLLRSKLIVTGVDYNKISEFVIQSAYLKDKEIVVVGKSDNEVYTFTINDAKSLVSNKMYSINGIQYRLNVFSVNYDSIIDTFMSDFSFTFNCIKAIDLSFNRAILHTNIDIVKKINDLLSELKDGLKEQLLELLNNNIK